MSKKTIEPDINQRISELELVAKQEYGWRMVFKALRQYRKRLEADRLTDRLPHLEAYIEELLEEKRR